MKAKNLKKSCFCGNSDCKPYTARIRIKQKQVKIGIYHSVCKGFTPIIAVEKPKDDYDEELMKNLLNKEDISINL